MATSSRSRLNRTGARTGAKRGLLNPAGPDEIPAGEFSAWLRGAEASLRSGKNETKVPCGGCTACCRSSMFIHIQPQELRTIQRIPPLLLFPAPGLPRGHAVLGYNDTGHCPMLTADQCTIYEDRPQTCRSYDCRIFAATGIPVDPQTQPEIAERVKAWVFDYESEESRRKHEALQEAAAFLQKNRDLFPKGSLPAHPAQLAALAVRIYAIFLGQKVGKPDSVTAARIMTGLTHANGDN